jgi:alkylhydroperoxidase family enzyme
MPRIEPAPPSPDGNPLSNSLLARVMGRNPEILEAFGRLDTTIRFKGRLPVELKEAVRRATAGGVGCEYCASLGSPKDSYEDRRISLAVGFAQMVADDPKGIDDGMFAVLREEFDEEEIVELVAWTTLVAIAGQMFGAVMGLEPASEDEAEAYQAALSALARR